MTALHSVAPAQRTGEAAAPTPSRTAEALELLRAAESVGGADGRSDLACQGSTTCARPGALTVVTEQGTVDLCGLHAMSVVFSTTAGPLVLVKSTS